MTDYSRQAENQRTQSAEAQQLGFNEERAQWIMINAHSFCVMLDYASAPVTFLSEPCHIIVNSDYYQGLGWMFALISAIFALGMTSKFARSFYPGFPDLSRRLAAPLIFALLSVACFVGAGFCALNGAAVFGLVLIFAARRKQRSDVPTA